MGFGSSSIETTSSWSLWKTMREFIEKARRAAVVDGGLLRSASPGRDQQTQAEIQPSTTTPPCRDQDRCKPKPFPTTTKGNRGESIEGKRNEDRGESRMESREGKRNEEREKNRGKKKKNLNRRVRNDF